MPTVRHRIRISVTRLYGPAGLVANIYVILLLFFYFNFFHRCFIIIIIIIVFYDRLIEFVVEFNTFRQFRTAGSARRIRIQAGRIRTPTE